MSTLALRVAAKAAQDGERARRGFFARWFDAMVAARMRQAEQEIAWRAHLLPAGPATQKDARQQAGSKDFSARPFAR